MLGFCLGTAEIGAVSRTELPRHIPVVLDFREASTGERQLELATLELHGYGLPSAPGFDDVANGVDLAFRDRVSEWPFRSVVLLVHRARGDLAAGDYVQAVIGLATSVEILCEAVIGEVLRVAGEPERAQAVVQAGLTNLVRDHLAPLLVRLGSDATAATDWLSSCYVLRKRVAHEGAIPQSQEAGEAFAATTKLAGVVGSALRSDPELAELGTQLPFGL